jgi:hypothetical protein
MNCDVVPPRTFAVGGATETPTDGTVIAAAEDLVLSAADVAVTVTIRLLAGAAAGALYMTGSPLAEDAGETVPQGAAGQLTAQVTPALAGSELTVALS